MENINPNLQNNILHNHRKLTPQNKYQTQNQKQNYFRYSKNNIMQLTVEVQPLKSRQVQQTRGERLHAVGTDIVVCNTLSEEGAKDGDAMG